MQFCTAFISTIMNLTKHGVILPTHSMLSNCQHSRHGGGTKLHYCLQFDSTVAYSVDADIIFLSENEAQMAVILRKVRK